MDTTNLLENITESALNLKAINPIQFEMEGKSAISDYVIVCHGTSIAHTQGIADKINFQLKQQGVLPIGIEGYENGEWILMDYNAVVVHIFVEENRELFDLEEIFKEYPQKSLQ